MPSYLDSYPLGNGRIASFSPILIPLEENMLNDILWWLDDHPIVKWLLFVIGALLLVAIVLAVFGFAVLFLYGNSLAAITNGWNQTIAPTLDLPYVTEDQAQYLFWFIAAIFFVAGLAFGLGKRIFGGSGGSSSDSS
jgi:hypothetical protein